MPQVAVLSAAPHIGRQIVASGTFLLEEVAEAAITIRARCIALLVQAVEWRHSCLFNREGTDPCIVAPVIRHNAVIKMTAGRVGNVYDRDCGEAR
jgi:hypothetical protein